MIIVDLNQVMISNIMMQLGAHTNAKVEENMVRHMVINSLLSYKRKFSFEYGELVIACDNTNIWRKGIFPHYKANRKNKIENSEIDWKSIHECMSKLKAELKEFSPYKVIDVESAEADDVIGTLVTHFSTTEPKKIIILSGDKDFIQLHKYNNVKQYDPVHKKEITHDDPITFLVEHIVKGDAGDGIPNILSSDDCMVIGERQKSLTKKRMEYYTSTTPENFDNSTVTRNYHRNEQLINLNFTPKEICEKVLLQYNEQAGKNRSKLLTYFSTFNLKNLVQHLSEF